MTRILIVGGYGAFGARAAERLAREPDLEVIIAGRSDTRAAANAASLRVRATAQISHAVVDAEAPDPEALRGIGPTVVINASGPFQTQDYQLARAAIAAGAHYIDLADARQFVVGIGALDPAAKAAGVVVTSGASSVPAVAAAIIDRYAREFSKLLSISHGITPGNAYQPGAATTASILGGLGQPMQVWRQAQWQTVYGWLDLWRYRFPGLGPRLMANCDVPDLQLFAARYPGVETVRFSAGLDVGVFQVGLWLMARAVRAGFLARPQRLASPLMAIKSWLGFLGTDGGGMFVLLRGVGLDGRPHGLDIHLIARNNQGPYVPAIASIILARNLARGRGLDQEGGAEIEAGARPCLGMVDLDAFQAEVADLAITITVATVVPAAAT